MRRIVAPGELDGGGRIPVRRGRYSQVSPRSGRHLPSVGSQTSSLPHWILLSQSAPGVTQLSRRHSSFPVQQFEPHWLAAAHSSASYLRCRPRCRRDGRVVVVDRRYLSAVSPTRRRRMRHFGIAPALLTCEAPSQSPQPLVAIRSPLRPSRQIGRKSGDGGDVMVGTWIEGDNGALIGDGASQSGKPEKCVGGRRTILFACASQ